MSEDGGSVPKEKIIGVTYTADKQGQPDKVIRVKNSATGDIEDRSRNETIRQQVKAGVLRPAKPEPRTG